MYHGSLKDLDAILNRVGKSEISALRWLNWIFQDDTLLTLNG